MPSTSHDEIRAASFLRAHGLSPERYPKVRGRGRVKTPDYQVCGPDDLFFLCEVKSVLTATGLKGILHRTIFNSLTENIHEAVKQFRAVNSTHSVPNVIIWISHNFQINVHTFLDLVKGGITIQEFLIADLTKFRRGRFDREINDVDLHVWLESDDTPQYVLNNWQPHFAYQLQKTFGF